MAETERKRTTCRYFHLTFGRCIRPQSFIGCCHYECSRMESDADYIARLLRIISRQKRHAAKWREIARNCAALSGKPVPSIRVGTSTGVTKCLLHRKSAEEIIRLTAENANLKERLYAKCVTSTTVCPVYMDMDVMEGENKELKEELSILRKDFQSNEYNISDVLGIVLYGYDTITGLPAWGDHTAESLAREAAKRIRKLEYEREEWNG